MTNEERDLITRFIERVGGPAASAAPSGFASVPATTAQNLPPIDRDADALLAELFQKYPEARYRITQVAVVQEQALVQATQRIAAMQAEMQRVQQAAMSSGGDSRWGQPPQQAPSRGLFGGLFGGGRSAQPAYAPPPQQPQYAPPQYAPQAGAFQPQGQGFLGGALQTAAGVAGGVLAANALTSLFSGGHGAGGMFGSTASASETGYLPGSEAASSPWAAPADAGAMAADPFDQGGAAKSEPAADEYADNSAWAPASDPGQDSGWQDTSGGDSTWDSGGDSGWTDSSSDA